jgi:hypothetical protein
MARITEWSEHAGVSLAPIRALKHDAKGRTFLAEATSFHGHTIKTPTMASC